MKKELLSKYFEILEGKRIPKFQIAKSIEVSFNSSFSSEKLWKIHNETIKKFDKIVAKNDCKSLKPAKKSLLDLKIELSRRILEKCELCERNCKVNRNKTLGFCGVKETKISSMFAHWGEEEELIPSGTIFFSGCNFKCQYCQNWDISQYPDSGYVFNPKIVAEWIEKANIINVNWVGGEPTPNLYFILRVLKECERNLPSIWNSNMYMSKKTMEILYGTQDIFLTDFKYGNDECALRLSKVQNYFKIVSRNHVLASKQAELIIRHLVLPNHLKCCTKPILKWISENLPDTRLNIMAQYRPEWKAKEYKEIARPLKLGEYQEAIKIAKEFGLKV